MRKLTFNPRTPEIQKKCHAYLSKPVGKSCRFVLVCLNFKWESRVIGLKSS